LAKSEGRKINEYIRKHRRGTEYISPRENTMDIEVIELKLILGSSRSLKAVADVRVGDWEIHNWKVVQQNDHRAQVEMPQVAWRDSSGQLRFRKLLSIPGELRQRIEVAILSAWEKEKQGVTKTAYQ
jgi:hypothetical protein